MKNILQEIEARIRKKKLAKERAAQNVNIHSYINSFIKNIEDLDKVYKDKHDIRRALVQAQDTLMDQLRVFDPGATVMISYTKQDDKKRFVDRVTIKWSDKYQKENNVDPELTLSAVDIALMI